MGGGLDFYSLVIDSWPIMEWLKGREPASSRLDAIVADGQLGHVQLQKTRLNYGGVVYSMRKTPDIADRLSARNAFYALPLRLHPVDDSRVNKAVELKSTYSFAYADVFAAAPAIRLDVPLVTGDREFHALEADGLLALTWVGA